MSKILCFDPSGNHAEGNGTTGWALFEDDVLEDFDDIKAKESATAESYWDEHLKLIDFVKPDVVVYETYKLQAGKALQQSWSQLETPQLIGVIRHACYVRKIECVGQDPSIKPRFSDEVMRHTGIILDGRIRGRRTNLHMRDAIRHGMYYVRYRKGKGK